MEKQLNINFLLAATTSHPKSIHSTWNIFIDGASRGNPGLSGAGIYIEYNNKKIASKSVFLGEKTNNQAEYLALALGIYFLKKELAKKNPPHNITITSDSELLIKQMRGEYKVKDKTLAKLKSIALSLIDNLKCNFVHVLRINNKKADKLANIAIDKRYKIPAEFSKILQEKGL